jgi:hypothetical protein
MIHPGEGNQPPSPGYPESIETLSENRRNAWLLETASAAS